MEGLELVAPVGDDELNLEVAGESVAKFVSGDFVKVGRIKCLFDAGDIIVAGKVGFGGIGSGDLVEEGGEFFEVDGGGVGGGAGVGDIVGVVCAGGRFAFGELEEGMMAIVRGEEGALVGLGEIPEAAIEIMVNINFHIRNSV